LENSVETEIQFQPLLNDCDKHIHRDSNPDLSFHCILRSPIEGFDPQVLLDPAKKQFDLPAAFVQLGDCKRRDEKIVRQEG
jgi:hypothetical protein